MLYRKEEQGAAFGSALLLGGGLGGLYQIAL